MRRLTSLITIALCSLLARPAQAHWCDDLWGSSYNIAVHPETDTVTVPATGSVDLDVWVQNNMGYPLKNFTLTATISSAYTISVSRDAPTVPTYLMPGEKNRYTLNISRSGGSEGVSIEDIIFFVSFGDGSQSQLYGDDGEHVMVRKTDGNLDPDPAPGLGSGHPQALHLRHSATADYGDLDNGLDGLFEEYCAGRRSWDHAGSGVNTSNCPDISTTVCSTLSLGTPTKWDWQKLWAAQELAYRRDALGGRLDTFRDRLQCGWDDSHLSFQAMAAFVLGYLGDDYGSARSFLEYIITNGSANEIAIAKASLLLMGDSSDYTLYAADVTAATSSSVFQVAEVSAAALGIIDLDDDAITDYLLPRARWVCPGGCDGPGDEGEGYLAAHLLAIVAWDRRGWTTDAGATGAVSFYDGVVVDTTPPAAPANIDCSPEPEGGIRLSWDQVTEDQNGDPETVTNYRVYSGDSARPGGATRPGELGFDYDDLDSTGGLVMDFSSLSGTTTYYFTVTAEDLMGNSSVYSAEVDCLPPYSPVAAISCSPLSGDAPLSVTCIGTSSSDANGSGDIVSYTMALDGAAPAAGSDITYDFPSAGGHTVVLAVTDSTDLSDTDAAVITVNTPGNTTPTAQAAATPISGQVALEVDFSSAGSADPDAGQSLSYEWDFRDGSSSTAANPTHTFSDAGSYDVILTVSDDFTPAASAVAIVAVEVLGNQPPIVTAASATPLFGPAPLLVTFDASGIYDPDDNNIAVTWDFGDGSATSSDLTVTHSYDLDGGHTATLSAQDDGTPVLAPATRTFAVTVGEQSNQAPNCAAATVTPISGAAPLSIALDASGCTDANGDSLSYLWRIPVTVTTEETFDSATALHTIDEPGNYTIRLAVTDDGSAPQETARDFYVTVLPADSIGMENIVGSCGGCSSSQAGRSSALLGVIVGLALFWRRRR